MKMIAYLLYICIMVCCCDATGGSLVTTYSCPKDFSLTVKGEYQWCHFFGTDRTGWSDARHRCLAMGGHLAKIETQKENEYIHSVIRFHNWFGLIDIDDTNSIYVYVDVPDKSLDYKNWHHSEPEFNDDCVVIGYWHGFWYDALCYYPMDYVCEAKVIESSILTCPDGWIKNDADTEKIYACYKVETKRLNFEDATKKCTETEGAFLYVPTTEAESEFVTVIANVPNLYWIDLSDVKSEGHFETATGESLIHIQWNKHEPYREHPNDPFNHSMGPEQDDEDCVSISVTNKKEGFANSEKCFKKLPFVCKLRF